MNKKFRKLVDCPEIQDRYFPADDTPKSLGIDGVYYSLLEQLMNECEKEIMLVYENKYDFVWTRIDEFFLEWFEVKYPNGAFRINSKVSQTKLTEMGYGEKIDRKTAWVEYLVSLIQGEK